MRAALHSVVLLAACATPPTPTPPPAAARPATTLRLPDEVHLSNLRQLTFEGENAEAYWRFDGKGLSLQARGVGEGCDRIQALTFDAAGKQVTRQVSSGNGATTCAHWLPGGDELLYASTHLAGPACPPRPDMSLGYVWALYDSYDLFKAKAPEDAALPVQDEQLVRLTDTKGYDAEGTVCGKDGSIVFTSVRDGDLELYRMDQDGKNVRRLTFTPGYDGGAFFNSDCTKLVWRASRPKPGQELEDYQRLLAAGLVRPSKLELFVANADGSDARQVTYLNAASFAPFWFPSRDRIIFSSNAGDPKGREFDLWAVNADGTDLERVTFTRGFDGFPVFSPDGATLAFSSNRMTPEGRTDTNVFLATWVDGPPRPRTGPAERIRDDVAWLAAAEREGRGLGTKGLEASVDFVEARLRALGLEGAAPDGSFRHAVEVPTKVSRGPKTALTVAGRPIPAGDFTPLGFSAQGAVEGPLVLVGYGLEDDALGLDDFRGVDLRGKVALVRRFVPDHPKLATPEAQRRAGDLRKKVFLAKSKGATAVLVVDAPLAPAGAGPKEPVREAPLPALRLDSLQDAGLPVLAVTRAALAPALATLERRRPVRVALTVELAIETSTAVNVVARRPGATPGQAVIVGAHLDHLGFGGPHSLAPDSTAPHPGADDNASGVATLLEVARQVASAPQAPPRDVVFAAFSAEEAGVLGSSALVAAKPAWLQGAWAMLNLDMVGRLRLNELSVLGAESAPEWRGLVDGACQAARVRCAASGDGYGPSDHVSFYAAGVPVLHFFTGAHGDYHKPSDTPDKVNAIGALKVSEIIGALVQAPVTVALTYTKFPAPVRGDARSFNASLGTVPNYGAGLPGVKGVLLDDVRPGGGAAAAGMRRGDVIVRLGRYDVGSVEDLMFVLTQAKPGETVKGVVVRDGQRVELEVTFQEGRRR
ncbi:MAG: M20/M25/M40 family metallo-hydrolase [Myxococcaceae bacterium]|nr:M20/M25/M40 family metallo-hydrolase [Myxococcaceae bacterium]MCA3010859.1 M20/M25/M40 family metallo-hydrolase [Myxococcaceae bacterium]